jgi:phage tail sheath gpL-like
MVSFNLVPSTLRAPWTAVEFDGSQAQQGPALLAYSAIIIGQKLAAGTATTDTFMRCPDVATAIAAGGRGSMLHRQVLAWSAVNQSTDLWIGVLADNGAGVAATGTIVFTAAATAAGTLAGYFGGVLVPTAVAAGDATTALATNTAAAINAKADLPITATVSGSTVTMLFRHKGLAGNSYDVRFNYNPGEVLPAGVALTITALGGVVAGTTSPSLTNLIAAMSAQWFEIWTDPYTDATSMTALEAELLSRAGPLRAIDGYRITSASAAALSTLQSLGTGRNSPYSTIVAPPGNNPLTPPMEFAARVAARVALAGALDPARPFQTLLVDGALPVLPIDVYDVIERDTLLHSGIATTRNEAGGVVVIDRMITTYQTNPSGQPDTAYLDATTILTLLLLRYDFRVHMSKYSRHKLAADATRFAPGQPVMTPALGRSEALTWFRDNEERGLVQDIAAFKAALTVELNPSDPNRLDFLLPPTLMAQLIVTAARIEFRL